MTVTQEDPTKLLSQDPNAQLKKLEPKSYCYFLLTFTFLTFPLSVTLKSILIPLAVLTILIQPSARLELIKILKEPWCIATLLLFGLILIGCLPSEAPWKSQVVFIEKYSKLLLLPIL